MEPLTILALLLTVVIILILFLPLLLPLPQKWRFIRLIKQHNIAAAFFAFALTIFLLSLFTLSVSVDVANRDIFDRQEDQFYQLPHQAKPPLPKRKPPLQNRIGTEYSTLVVEKVIRLLEWGSIAFNAPEKLQIDESGTINVLLSPKRSEAELAADLKKKLEDMNDIHEKERIETTTIKISNRMRAELYGPAFDIQPITPSEQAIRTDETTQWSWTIKPIEFGKQSLDLTISALITVSGKDTPMVIETFRKTILIEISPLKRVKDFITSNWQWLWATLLVPLVTYLWNRRKKTKPAENSMLDRLRQGRGSRYKKR